jgi:hypothetical protein
VRYRYEIYVDRNYGGPKGAEEYAASLPAVPVLRTPCAGCGSRVSCGGAAQVCCLDLRPGCSHGRKFDGQGPNLV